MVNSEKHKQAVRESNARRRTTYEYRRTPEYMIWVEMRARCNNPKHKYYHNYGGRGISVCERWDSFFNFLNDIGKRPTDDLTLERLDNGKGYSPDNCAWVSRKQNNCNRRTNNLLTIDGKTLCLAEWCQVYDQPYSRTYMRIYYLDWPPVAALTATKNTKKPKH